MSKKILLVGPCMVLTLSAFWLWHLCNAGLDFGKDASPSRTSNDALVVAIAAPPSNLDPRIATDATGSRLVGLLFSSLVRIGSDLEIVGDAATSWTYADHTYRFKLRHDLRFSNGRPVTPEDIEFSFADALSKTSPFAVSFTAIDQVKASEDEVSLHLSEFSAPILRDLARIKILPKKEIQEAKADFGRMPMGSGPYRLAHVDANEIELEPNPFHPYLKPKLAHLLFKIVRDDNTRYLKLSKGELDLAQQELPPSKVVLFEGKPGFQILRGEGLSVNYLLLNFKDSAFNNLAVRKALSLAIDRASLIQYKLYGLAHAATSLLTPANPFFFPDLKPETFDPIAAKAAIREAGLDGHVITLKSSNTPLTVETSRVIANELRKIGFDCKIQSFEWGTFYNDIQHGNFQIAMLKWVAVADPDIYRLQFDSHQLPPLGRNRGAYSNPRLDILLEAAPGIIDLQKRRSAYNQIQKIVFDDTPIVPLWYEQEVAVVRTNVKGYKLARDGSFFNFIEVSK